MFWGIFFDQSPVSGSDKYLLYTIQLSFENLLTVFDQFHPLSVSMQYH